MEVTFAVTGFTGNYGNGDTATEPKEVCFGCLELFFVASSFSLLMMLPLVFLHFVRRYMYLHNSQQICFSSQHLTMCAG